MDDPKELTRSEAYWDKSHPDHRKTVDRVASALSEAPPAMDETGESTALEQAMEAATAAPASPDDYDFSHLDQSDWDERLETEARAWLHGIGASTLEAKMFSRRAEETAQMDYAARERLMASSEQTLRRVWGDQFDENVAAVENVISQMGPGFRDFLIRSGLNNDAGVIAGLLRKAKR